MQEDEDRPHFSLTPFALAMKIRNILPLLFLVISFLFASCHREKPEAVLKETLTDPLPVGLKVLKDHRVSGSAGSVRVYELETNDLAAAQIRNAKRGHLAGFDKKKQNSVSSVLRMFKISPPEDFGAFEYFEYEAHGHFVRFLLKEPFAYCVITR